MKDGDVSGPSFDSLKLSKSSKGGRSKVREYASKILCELLFIFLIPPESIALLATPAELLRLTVEDIDDQRANLCDISGGRRDAVAAETRHLQPHRSCQKAPD
jgi:hypothetical protein